MSDTVGPGSVAEQAVALAKSAPHKAISLAENVVKADVEPNERATALWALGQARHELGDNGSALRSLQEAIGWAGDPLRSRIEVTTAAVESAVGRSDAAISRLSGLIDHQDSRISGLALSQRGLIKLYGGNGIEALDDLRRSLPLLEADDGDGHAIARVRSNLGFCLTVVGEYRAAVADLERAYTEAKSTGQATVAAAAKQNLGYARAQLGHLPEALRSLEEARAEYQAMGDPSRGLTGLYDDLAETYRLAGLTADAVRYARVGSWTARQGDNVERQAEAEYRRAVCLLEHGNKRGAVDAAGRAASLFEQTGRRLWRQRAELIVVEASSGDSVEPDVVERISALAEDLFKRGHVSEPRSLINRLTHRLIDTNRVEEADVLLSRHGDETRKQDQGMNGPDEESVLDRLESFYRAALIAVLGGRSADEPLAEARATVAEHSLALGDQELRAGSTRLTERFRSLAIRNALSTGADADGDEQARRVLLAEEEWRAIALTLPRAVAAADDDTAELLVDLRKANRAAPGELPELELDVGDDQRDRRAELEDQLRLRSMTGRPVSDTALDTGSDTAVGGPPSEVGEQTGRRASLDRSFIDNLTDQLDNTVVLEWVEHQGELVGVGVAPDGSARTWSAGKCVEADRLARFIHRSLGDLNQVVDDAAAWSALDDLRQDCAELRELLWPAKSDGWLPLDAPSTAAPTEASSYVLSPPASLMALPWRMIAGSPSRSVEVTLTPSLEHWSRLKMRPAGGSLFHRSAVVSGPGLLGVSADEAVVARVLPDIEVINESQAACDRVKLVLASADFVHLACHGWFRPESPRFSSLTMVDGPLTLFELDWLERVPDVVMLAACDSGKVSSRPGGELLGTAPALLASGASTVIAPISPVRDLEVTEVLEPFYRSLSGGLSAAAAAMDDAVVDGRPELIATAAAFQVVGATVTFTANE